MAARTDLDDLDLALEEPDLPGEPWFSRFRPLRSITLVAAGPERAAAYVSGIAAEPPWAAGELRIWEGTSGAVDLVTTATATALDGTGWEARPDPDLSRALWGTDVIVHACDYLAPADREAVLDGTAELDSTARAAVLELAAALRTVSGQRSFASTFGHDARGVPVLTTTEPLWVSTAQLASTRLPVLGVETSVLVDVLAALGGRESELPVWVVDGTRRTTSGDARHGHRVRARLLDTHRQVLDDEPGARGSGGRAAREHDELVLTAAFDPVHRHVAAALRGVPGVPAAEVDRLADRVLQDFEDWLLWS